MKAVRCNNGHYYDADKYESCPYCSDAAGGGDEGKTVSFAQAADEEKTVSYAQSLDEEKTVAFSASAVQSEESREEISSPVVGWLVCVKGPERGRDYRLQAGRNFVGRSLDMDVCIRDDAAISRDNHFSLVYDPRSGRFVLLPGETSETKLNGESLYNIADLKVGDMIDCGESSLCFIGFCKEGRTW